MTFNWLTGKNFSKKIQGKLSKKHYICQYLSLNERNYAIYGQNSSNKDEQSNFVRADLIYGRDAVQESFSNLKKFKSRFVRQGLSLVGSPLNPLQTS